MTHPTDPQAVKESFTTDPQAELREQIGAIFVKNDLRTDQRAISELMQLLTTERERVIGEVLKLVTTHTEHDGRYCDTGADMDWSCRSECVEMAVKRIEALKKAPYAK